MYERGGFKELRDQGFEGTWVEWFLKETETFHAKARRYTSPDEHPFTPNLPGPLLPGLQMPSILYGPATESVNLNASILSFYTRLIVPRITRRATEEFAAYSRAKGKLGSEEFEDDGNYGSAAIADVAVLQVISKRIHYGKFVSESKFRSNPAAFIPHIENPNPDALDALITKPAVEQALLKRLGKKASTYSPVIEDGGAADGNEGNTKWKIDVEDVRELYEKWIIPLTKKAEVDYLLHRLDGLSKEEINELRNQAPLT